MASKIVSKYRLSNIWCYSPLHMLAGIASHKVWITGETTEIKIIQARLVKNSAREYVAILWYIL